MEGALLIMQSTEASYRREWATLTGKSESEIYVPEAIREDRPLAVGDRIRILQRDHMDSRTDVGDLLQVRWVSEFGSTFSTNAPRGILLGSREGRWSFDGSGEGTGWERV